MGVDDYILYDSNPSSSSLLGEQGEGSLGEPSQSLFSKDEKRIPKMESVGTTVNWEFSEVLNKDKEWNRFQCVEVPVVRDLVDGDTERVTSFDEIRLLSRI